MRNLLITVTLLLLLVSCKTHQTVIQKKEIKNLSPEILYDSLKSNYGNITTFLGRCKIEISQNKKVHSLNGIVKIKKDSIVWASVNPGLGIEVARLQCLNDSVQLIDRLNSKFFIGKYNYLNSLINVEIDYSSLQSIFLNTLSFYTSITDTSLLLKNSIIKKDNNGKYIQLENFRKRFIKKNDNDIALPPIYERVRIDNRNLKISEVFIKDFKDDYQLFVDYSSFVYKDEIKAEFPQQIEVTAQKNNKIFKVKIMFTKLEFNNETQYQFSIPSGYKPMQLNSK